MLSRGVARGWEAVMAGCGGGGGEGGNKLLCLLFTYLPVVVFGVWIQGTRRSEGIQSNSLHTGTDETRQREEKHTRSEKLAEETDRFYLFSPCQSMQHPTL